MDSGVILDVVVYPVAPGITPAVSLEQVLHDGRRIAPVAEIDCAPVDDERPSRAIGDETVI
jgi:hypothetical protein